MPFDVVEMWTGIKVNAVRTYRAVWDLQCGVFAPASMNNKIENCFFLCVFDRPKRASAALLALKSKPYRGKTSIQYRCWLPCQQ